MEKENIGFFGAGYMGWSLASGLITGGVKSKEQIFVCDKYEDALEKFEKAGFMNTTTDQLEIVRKCKILFICVKPFDVPKILDYIKDHLEDTHLVVSIAAGITTNSILESLDFRKIPIIRVMPNNSCQVNASATVYSLGEYANDDQGNYIEKVLESVGLCERVSERLMNSYTGFTGTGPAYAYLFIQALADGAVRNGIQRDLAIKLAAQIAIGAGKVVLETKVHPAELIDKVMTPAGTTCEGIFSLERHSFRAALIDAVTNATKRSEQLGQFNEEKGRQEMKKFPANKKINRRRPTITFQTRINMCTIKCSLKLLKRA